MNGRRSRSPGGGAQGKCWRCEPARERDAGGRVGAAGPQWTPDERTPMNSIDRMDKNDDQQPSGLRLGQREVRLLVVAGCIVWMHQAGVNLGIASTIINALGLVWALKG